LVAGAQNPSADVRAAAESERSELQEVVQMKPLKTAGDAIVIGLLLGIVSLVYAVVKILPYSPDQAAMLQALSGMSTFVTVVALISIVITFFVYYGFVTLGNKTKNKLIIYVSWLLMIFLILQTLLTSVFRLPSLSTSQASAITVIILSILMLLMGIGLVQIRKKVSLANAAGILYIISGATLFILIGAIVHIAALILAAIMFIKASRTFKEK